MSFRYAILGILQNQAKHGYEIKQEIEESFGSTWNVSYGQLYPTLRNLTQKNLVRKNSVPGQKSLKKNVYAITELGKETLAKWFTEIPKKVNITGKDEFSLMLLFLFQKNSSEERLTVISKQLSFYQKMKEKYLEQLQHSDEKNEMLPTVLLKRILYRIEAEISWLSEMLSDNA
jgi:PadR family transcriptional regulator, regulatory protein AphA